jgi:N-acetylmuramoyl-L-alanine amidase
VNIARLVCLVLLFAGFAAIDLGAVQARPVPGVTCPTGSAQVVLDPGHGGSDIGAVNQSYGLREKDVTLDVANRAAALLSGAYGYSVALTRYEDVNLGNSERGEVANACGALVYVSIHFNGASDPAIDYTKVFWGKKRKDLAFCQTMSGAMNALGIPNNGTGQFANGALLQASMPSALVETVFLTSDYEGQLLADPNSGRRDQIAAAIASGIATWIG